jgi:DNA-binding response OmpR family regulator
MTYVSDGCIWIVEDDPDVREALADALGAEGYCTVLASNGKEAMDLADAATSLPALILLDLAMPVMGGAEFRRLQRVHPTFAMVPVIVLTAGRLEPSEVAALGVAAFVTKPPELNELLDAVHAHGVASADGHRFRWEQHAV